MKKLIALTLAMLMVLGLFAGCATTSKAPAKTDENKGNTPSASENEGEQNEEPAVTFTTVEEGKLTMATNAFFPPYEFYEGDKIVGIDAEIAQAIAEKLGLELVIKDMEFDSIITDVKQGASDFGLAGLTVSPERLEEVDFSISYASGVQVVIVKEGSPITSVKDLLAEGATYKAGVQLGTTGDTYATGDLGSERVVTYNKGNEAVMALIAGDIDCVVIDNEPAKAFVKNNPGLMILEASYADEDYAACFAQDNDALREAIDEIIKELTADGTIDAIVAKYIPAE